MSSEQLNFEFSERFLQEMEADTEISNAVKGVIEAMRREDASFTFPGVLAYTKDLYGRSIEQRQLVATLVMRQVVRDAKR